jgi:hypothetical protein
MLAISLDLFTDTERRSSSEQPLTSMGCPNITGDESSGAPVGSES